MLDNVKSISVLLIYQPYTIQLEAVDGHATIDMRLRDVLALLRGPEGESPAPSTLNPQPWTLHPEP